ncbi:MAG TPA: site-2 protease family protein [Streptosporangiaceae bacterium]|nr:site-2 protease family protein [Streptosporangiaceae bacterium]
MSPEQPGDQPPQRARREGRYGLVIARPFGVPVYISPYWFLVAALVVVYYAGSLPDSIHPSAVRYAVAATFVVLLYASVLVHELSHCVVARAFGLTVRRILLWPLGGFSEIEQEPQTPVREFAVSAVGPATSLALAGLGFAVITLVDLRGIPRDLIDQLILANLVVGVFNLLPGLPLDGGRMLRAGVWKITKRPGQATIAAAWGGRVLAVLMVAVPVAVLGRKLSLTNTWLLWPAFIAVFMWISSGQAIRAAKVRDRLPGLQARRLARRAIAIPGNVPLSEAIRQADEAQARALVVIDHDSTPIAIVNETAVMATPPQRRPWIEVGSLARAIEPGIVLSADLAGIDLIEAVQRAPATEYLLIEPSGQVFGVLATTDLDHAFAGV